MTRREILVTVAVIGGLAAIWIGSEVHYGRSISPTGIHSAQDFFVRFGEPRRIRMVQHDGQSYYEFSGRLPSGIVLATPSAPPVYVFDEQGRFVDWCRDPGDMPSYHQTWILESTNEVEVGVVRQKFGIR